MSGSTHVTSEIRPGSISQQPAPTMLFSWFRSVGTYGFRKLIKITRRQARLHFMASVPDRMTLWHYEYPTYLPARAWKRHSAYLLYRKTKKMS